MKRLTSRPGCAKLFFGLRGCAQSLSVRWYLPMPVSKVMIEAFDMSYYFTVSLLNILDETAFTYSMHYRNRHGKIEDFDEIWNYGLGSESGGEPLVG